MSTGKDLTPRSRGLITIGAVIQFALLAYAWLDLRKRADAQVRGSKRLWKRAVFVNFIGPLAYLLAGRRKDA